MCKKGVRGVHSRSRYTQRLWKFRVHPGECVCKKGVRGVHSRSRYTHRLWKFRVHPAGGGV